MKTCKNCTQRERCTESCIKLGHVAWQGTPEWVRVTHGNKRKMVWYNGHVGRRFKVTREIGDNEGYCVECPPYEDPWISVADCTPCPPPTERTCETCRFYLRMHRECDCCISDTIDDTRYTHWQPKPVLPDCAPKPPLGIMPEFLYYEKRCQDLMAAIARHADRGEVTLDRIDSLSQWVYELKKQWHRLEDLKTDSAG